MIAYDGHGIVVRHGDARDELAAMADESVQCVITSPPYFGLRKYAGLPDSVWGGDPNCCHEWRSNGQVNRGGIGQNKGLGWNESTQNGHDSGQRFETGATCRHCSAWLGQLGNEPTVDLYMSHLIDVFRAVKRVLRRDGCVFLNIADSYSGNGGTSTTGKGAIDPTDDAYKKWNRTFGVPSKNLLLVPERLAIALQEDDWIIRSRICWAKTSAMPESVRDRPTSAHETIWMLCKSGEREFWTHRDGIGGMRTQPDPDYRWFDNLLKVETDVEPENWRDDYLDDDETKRWRRFNLWTGHDYFYDAEAVRQPYNSDSISRYETPKQAVIAGFHQPGIECDRPNILQEPNPNGANLRNVWLDSADGADLSDLWVLGPSPFKDAHFATFVPKLVQRCILAATSEHGACAACGAPWRRVTERGALTKDANARMDQWNYGKLDSVLGDFDNGGKAATMRHSGFVPNHSYVTTTTGWEPTCTHHSARVPCLTLDPFGGSGTTAVVARSLGRRCVLIEGSAEYVQMSIKRIEATPLHLVEEREAEAVPVQLDLLAGG